MSISVLNTDAGLSGKTIVNLEDTQTFSGVKTFGADVLFTDALYDIGKSGATRPRDGFFSRNVVVGNNLTPGTVVADMLFTDALYDIGKVGATRPRDVFLSRDLAFGRRILTPNILNSICEGRLTLTSGTPVTTADVTGATTIYFTPYKGTGVALYDGTDTWTLFTFTELSLALGTLTSGLPYDVFLYNNAGTLTLESLAWTNGTTRATALVTQNGVLSKTGALTRRYLGTFYTTSTTATEDSAAKRFLWNYYNRVPRRLARFETTATWTYTTATIRQANGATANQLDTVVGWAEVVTTITVAAQMKNTDAVNVAIGIGKDSTSTMAAEQLGGSRLASANTEAELIATAVIIPTVGRHYYAWVEVSQATGTTTWTINHAASGTTATLSGIHGWQDG